MLICLFPSMHYRSILSPYYNTILRNRKKKFDVSTFITDDNYCAIKSNVLDSTKMRDFFFFTSYVCNTG